MNGYERTIAALHGEPHDRTPVMLHNFMMAAREINVSMRCFREDSKKIAQAFIHAVEKYDYDAVFVDIDTVTLAGSLGVPVDFPEDEPARPISGLGTPELVRQKTTELLNIFSKINRFILNAGCAIPAITPEENIFALVETAKNYK